MARAIHRKSTRKALRRRPEGRVSLRSGVRDVLRSQPLKLRLSLATESGDTLYWLHIAREGTWKGHADEEFTLNAETFAQMVSNFEALGEGATLPLYYEHPKFNGDGQPVPQAGRIHALVIDPPDREAGLWAKVRYTARALGLIESDEIEFCSMSFLPDGGIDRETGEDVGALLFNVGLTNDPFILGLAPITLSASPYAARPRQTQNTRSLSMTASEKIAQLASTLNLDPNAEDLQWVISDAIWALFSFEKIEDILDDAPVATEGVDASAAKAKRLRARKALSRAGIVDKKAFRLSRMKLRKLSVDVEEVIDALEELPPEPTAEQVEEVVEVVLEAMDDEVEASGEEGEPKEPTETTGGEGEENRPTETSDSDAAQTVISVLGRLAETTGKDETEVASMLDSMFEQLVAMLQAEGGDPATIDASVAAAAAKLRRELSTERAGRKTLETQVKNLSARIDAAEAEKKAAALELRRAEIRHRLEQEHVVDGGDGGPTHDDLIDLALSNEGLFERTLRAVPRVPTGTSTTQTDPTKRPRRIGASATATQKYEEHYEDAKVELRQRHPEWSEAKVVSAANNLAHERAKQS